MTRQPARGRGRSAGRGAFPRQRGATILLAAAGLLVLLSAPAAAHGPTAHRDLAWWQHWNWDLPTLASLGICMLLYAVGLRRLWRRAGVGQSVTVPRAVAFLLGMVTLLAALVSPLDPLSDELSWVHMVQHMLLMMVAAPLCVLGQPLFVATWALPAAVQQWLGRWQRRIEAWHSPWYLFWQPLLLWSVYACALWLWHLPALYTAALRHRLVHELQHLLFFGTAYLFWRVLLDPLRRLRLNRGAGVLYLFTTSLHATVLGVFMALSPRVWYPDYEGRTLPYRLTALEDQQLAGLIMWMPACMVYAIGAAVLFALWLHEPQATRRSVAERSHS